VSKSLTINSTGARGFCSFDDGVVRVLNPGAIALGASTGAVAPLDN
jgi:hypothetical protein